MTRKMCASSDTTAPADGSAARGILSAHGPELAPELSTILELVKEKTGHDFASYKSSTVMRRLERRLALTGAAGIGDYLLLLMGNADEVHAFARDILIGVTSFFRDPEAFEVVRREILPRLFRGGDSDQSVRIWHAGCSTGEEVYSMAILVMEYLAREGKTAKVQFFATDIDDSAVNHARAGIYPGTIAAEVGPERLQAYFTRVQDSYQIAKPVREMILFAQHSLVKDPPFSRLDLLVCRNFLIYLNPEMQHHLIAIFHHMLKPGGYLFLGAAETVGRCSELFAQVDKKWKIYSRQDVKGPFLPPFPFATPLRPVSRPASASEGSRDPGSAPGALAERALLERYAPPSVVVNEKYQVVHISNGARRFLEVPAGEPTHDVLRMVVEEVRPALRAAVYKAFTDGRQTVFRGVQMCGSTGESLINVVAEPLDAGGAAGRLVLVIFETAPQRTIAPLHREAEGGGEGDAAYQETLIRQLEAQLVVTHEQLQAANEQLETSHEGLVAANEELMSMNEEYQSANEELHSTNEELETSREELQVLNEELVTVNAELHGKVEELNSLNGDMENLLTCSQIATLFLDRELRVKRYTPGVAAIFNLIPADLGRPLHHLARDHEWRELTDDCRGVLETLLPRDREVTTADRLHYLVRILPYRSLDGVVDGVVLTFVDLSARKIVEEALRESEERQRLFIEHAPAALAMFDREMRYLFVSNRWRKDYGLGDRDLRGESHYQVFPELPEEWKDVHRRGLAGEVLRSDADRFERADGAAQWLRWEVRPWYDAAGDVGGIVIFSEDLTDLKQSEIALRHVKEEWESTFHSVPDLICILDDQHRIVRANRAMAERLGVTPEECVGKRCYETVHCSETAPIFCPHSMTVADGLEHMAEVEEKGLGGHFLVTTTPIRYEDGRLAGTVHVARDITERKHAEVELASRKAEAEQHLAQMQAILDHLNDGVVISDLSGQLFHWNPAAVAMHGFASMEEGLRMLSEFADIFRLCTEEEGILPLDRWPLARILAGEVLRDWEVTVSRRDMEWRRVFSYGGTLARGADGNPLLAIVSVTDVTERKRTEEAQARLAAIVESSDDAIIAKDLEGTIRTWNGGAERMFGLSATEALGQPISLLIPPELRQEEDHILHKVAAGARIDHYETVRLTKDGTPLQVSVTVSPVRDKRGRIIGASKIVRDIARQKEAEAALKESEAQFRTLADAIPQLAWIANADGWIFWYNQRWYDYTGTTPEQMEGWGWRSVHDPEVLPEVLARWQESIATGHPFDMVFPLRGADGIFRPFLTRVLPLRNQDGTVVRWFGTNTDIEQHRKAEEALRRAHDQLEQRVRERTEELAGTVEALLEEITQRERVEQSLIRLNRLYAVFSEIDQAIVRASDRETLFQDFCRIAVEEGGFLLAWVGLVDAEERVSVAAARGATGYLEDIVISARKEPMGQGPTGSAIRQGTYCICNDFQSNPGTLPWHEKGKAYGIRSSAAIALRQDERVVGALTLYSSEAHFFDEQQVTLLQRMGGDITFALDNLLREARRWQAERALHEEALERLRATEALREKERLLIQQSRHAALGEMLGNIAHQWRQPLNAVGLMIQELSLTYEAGEFDSGYLEGIVAKVMQIIFHMSQTIDDFRNFFRPDKEKVRFSVREAVDKVISILHGSLKENCIAMEITVAGDPHIDGYPNEYSQVLLNILLNARDVFAERDVEDPRITVHIAEEAGRSLVVIADNGGGIPVEIMDKIFDPYFTTKGPDKGTGVGLYMSKAIIEKNMNGRVTACNSEVGAEFRIEV